MAKTEMKELDDKKGGKGKKRRNNEQDTEEGLGVSDRLSGGNKQALGGKKFKNKKKRMK